MHYGGYALRQRCEFLGVLGGAATWSVVAHTQQTMPIVAFLRTTSLATSSHYAAGFRQGLKEAGFVEGQNVAIEYHYADNQYDRIPTLVADALRRPAAVIFANAMFSLAVKPATATVPLVFAIGADPVKMGLVKRLNQPGGNITGIDFLTATLAAKRLGLLRQIAPKAATIGMLVHSHSPETASERHEVEAAAQTLAQNLIVGAVDNDQDIEPVITTLVKRGAGALLCGPGALLNALRDRIVAQVAHLAVPASYPVREYAAAGGLMSYGTDLADAFRQAGVYVGRILKGEKPADLPVVQASRFEFVINLKTARVLGLEIQPQLLAAADEVLE